MRERYPKVVEIPFNSTNKYQVSRCALEKRAAVWNTCVNLHTVCLKTCSGTQILSSHYLLEDCSINLRDHSYRSCTDTKVLAANKGSDMFSTCVAVVHRAWSNSNLGTGVNCWEVTLAGGTWVQKWSLQHLQLHNNAKECTDSLVRKPLWSVGEWELEQNITNGPELPELQNTDVDYSCPSQSMFIEQIHFFHP